MPRKGIFRQPQAFILRGANHMLAKLHWEVAEFLKAQWIEGEPAEWRQAMSYRAINCATTAWHMIEWIDEETRQAVQPRERLHELLTIKSPTDPPGAAPSVEGASKELTIRKEIVRLCPPLEICRVVALTGKHYEIRNRPNANVYTEAFLTIIPAGGPALAARPRMLLTATHQGAKHTMDEVFKTVVRFYEDLWAGVSAGGRDYSAQRGTRGW